MHKNQITDKEINITQHHVMFTGQFYNFFLLLFETSRQKVVFYY